jgi:hypothetical protein
MYRIERMDNIIAHWVIKFILMQININETVQLWTLIWVHKLSKLSLSWWGSNVGNHGVEFIFRKKKKTYSTWRLRSSRMWRRVVSQIITEISQEPAAYFIVEGQVQRISALLYHFRLPCVSWRRIRKIPQQRYPHPTPLHIVTSKRTSLSHLQGNFISRSVHVMLQPTIQLGTYFRLTERSDMYCDSSKVDDITKTWNPSLK